MGWRSIKGIFAHQGQLGDLVQASKYKIWIQLLTTIGVALLVVWTGVII